MIHGCLHTFGIVVGHGGFVFADGTQGRGVPREASLQNGGAGRVGRILNQIIDADVASECDLSRLVIFASGNDVEQCGFACSVACNESYVFSLANVEVETVKED